MSQSTRRYRLNSKQVHILKLMYKFRFITSSLLAEYKSVSSPIVMNNSLNILQDQNYIGRRYDNSYRLQGKGASYYLAPKALRLLRDKHSANTQVLHAMYKNKSVGEPFIDHNLDIFRTYLNLRASYPDTFHIFTKTELSDYGYFPDPRPDLYLNKINHSQDTYNEYVLDFFTNAQLFVIKKRLDTYIEHFDSGDWEAEVGTDYPVILLVCPDSKIEEKLQKNVDRLIDSGGIDDLKIYTTTARALLTAKNINAAIWADVSAPEILLTL